MGQIAFAKERFADVIDEAMPLLYRHWQELARYPDIELAVDYDSYRAIEAAGKLAVYTARDAGMLVGYAAFIVGANSHYCTSGPQAKQDVVYIAQEHRGGRVGLNFLRFCDDQLQADGVVVVYQHEKVSHPALGRVLAHIGYENVERIWARRLDGKG